MIMALANSTGLPTETEVVSRTCQRHSSLAWPGWRSTAASARRTISASTSTTALSTSIPKSIAPSEIRFADTPQTCMPINATNRERGITQATHHQGLVASTHDAAASIRAVVLQRVTHLRQRDIESAQLLGVDRDLIFLDCPTETDHVGNARDAAYGGAYHPIFQYAYVFDRHRRRCLHDVAINLTHAGRARGEVRLNPGRQRGVRQFLDDLLAGAVIFDTVSKGHGDDREAHH